MSDPLSPERLAALEKTHWLAEALAQTVLALVAAERERQSQSIQQHIAPILGDPLCRRCGAPSSRHSIEKAYCPKPLDTFTP